MASRWRDVRPWGAYFRWLMQKVSRGVRYGLSTRHHGSRRDLWPTGVPVGLPRSRLLRLGVPLLAFMLLIHPLVLTTIMVLFAPGALAPRSSSCWWP